MKTISVSIPTTQDLQRFAETLSGLSGDFEIINDNYLLDARSLMGLFSLDREKPISMKVYNDSKETMEALKPFTVSGKD